MGGGTIARTSHQLPAAVGDALHPAVFSHFGVLDVLSSTTPRSSDRKPNWAQRLADLATKAGEKCRLVADKQQGFTLVEILVALVILAFVALGIAGLFSHSMIVNASGQDYAVLASEARFALEALQARPFDDPALDDTQDTPKSWAPINPNFTISYTVKDYHVENWTDASGAWNAPVGNEVTNLKRISMTVASTNQVLQGRRVFTITALRIPG